MFYTNLTTNDIRVISNAVNEFNKSEIALNSDTKLPLVRNLVRAECSSVETVMSEIENKYKALRKSENELGRYFSSKNSRSGF